ncbi:ATP-binding protein, partial [Acinetobacter baumannii]
RLASEFGLVHTVLTWQAPRRDSGIQAAARRARYRLLSDHAARIGAGLVLTAHTLDDQAETVLMRLIAGSAPSGLAGMR